MRSLSQRVLVHQTVDHRDSFYESFGQLSNPFPINRTIFSDVLHNQETALDVVAGAVSELLNTPRQRFAIGVIGETGVGKTHFMRYCVNEVSKVAESNTRALARVEVQAGLANIVDIVHEAIRSADDVSRSIHKSDLLTTLSVRLVSRESEEILREVHHEDLSQMLRALIEEHGGAGFEDTVEVGRRWLMGATLAQAEKRQIGVTSKVGGGAAATRVLAQLFTLCAQLDVLDGLILAIDELEALFAGRLRKNQWQGYLQDLRYFYDEATRDDRGFSLMILSASTSYAADYIRQQNPPVYQRFGLGLDFRIQLEPITSVIAARDFAWEYIQFGNERWMRARPDARPTFSPRMILTEPEIERTYSALANHGRASLTQAQLLEALHDAVETKRRLDAENHGVTMLAP